MISFKPIFALMICGSYLAADLNHGFALQLDEVVPQQVVPTDPQPKTKPDDKKEGSEPETDTRGVPVEDKIGKQFAQLHLRDGSIIGGDIKIQSIDIKTKFGVLNVPIARVSKILPGLDGNPKLKQKITDLVKGLGATDITLRDASQRDLLAMGPKIKNVLNTFDDGGVAERGKRLEEIRAELDQIVEKMKDDLLDPVILLDFNDTVVTPNFSIVGEIQQKEFVVSSKFGRLQVQLGDILLADRMINRGRPEIRKNVTVDAMAFFQTKPQSAGIRVYQGDKIFVQANGIVQWTNLSNSGKLVARIGTDNSACVAVGAKGSFVAKKSGTLYLGISMRDGYANNSNYTWTGNYKAKVRVSPAPK